MFKTLALATIAVSASAMDFVIEPTDFASVDVVEHLFDNFFVDDLQTSFGGCGGNWAVSGGSVNPDPIKKGSDAALALNGHWSAAQTLGDITLVAKWNGVTLKTETDSAYNGQSVSGDWTYNFTYAIPGLAPSGSWVIEITGANMCGQVSLSPHPDPGSLRSPAP